MELALQNIESRIFNLRGQQVMLDSDLAEMYQTETKYINRAVHRNPSRFPSAFAFQLTDEEWKSIRFQIGTSRATHGGRRKVPTVFTEQGVSMLSAVLNTAVAIDVSIQIIQAFVAMRRTLGNLHGLLQRLEGLEIKQLQTDSKLELILSALETNTSPKQGVFFEGQLFDAHVFASNLIKKANKSLILIDNYVDETSLLLLSKRKKGVSCTVHTHLRPVLKKDLEKHNQQYPSINIIENSSSHDRFLIIDNSHLYHIGASLKDLGNKCFAFSRMDDVLGDIKMNLLKV
ncbi:MAG: hypothetical protein RIT07_1855 [Bacteroidota bacterium]|jgi:hypothetical protein